MQEELARSYQQIQDFSNEYVSGKYGQYKALKAAHNSCRVYLEERIASNRDIKKIIFSKDDQSLLLKELIVNYTLLHMHHHAVIAEIESHKPQFQGGK